MSQSQIPDYNDLLDIIISIKNMTLEDSSSKTNIKNKNKNKRKIIKLDFDEKKNVKRMKSCGPLLSSIHFQIQISSKLNDIINDYILGKMIEYVSLEKKKQNNIQNLIKYYNLVLILKTKKDEDQEINYSGLRKFLKVMKTGIILDVKDKNYQKLTNVSRLFIYKINKILTYLIDSKIKATNLKTNNYVEHLYNLFIMIFYILIKNQL